MRDGAGSREEAMKKKEGNGNNTLRSGYSVTKLSVWKVIKIDVKEASQGGDGGGGCNERQGLLLLLPPSSAYGCPYVVYMSIYCRCECM